MKYSLYYFYLVLSIAFVTFTLTVSFNSFVHFYYTWLLTYQFIYSTINRYLGSVLLKTSFYLLYYICLLILVGCKLRRITKGMPLFSFSLFCQSVQSSGYTTTNRVKSFCCSVVLSALRIVGLCNFSPFLWVHNNVMSF